MQKQLSAIANVCIGILLVGGPILPTTGVAADKIVVVSAESEPPDRVEALKKGLVTGFGLEFDAAATSYSLDSGYQIEFESDDSQMLAILQRQDVIAVICNLSRVCAHALNEAAPKDVLIVTIWATSDELNKGTNLYRLAPINALQVNLIYREVARDIGTQRFAIVYEPDISAMNLYTTFMSKYFMDIVLETEKPTLVSATPLHNFVDHLDDTHKSLKVKETLTILRQLQVEAVVYFGFIDGFTALTDSEQGGDPSVAKRWYASDAVYEEAKGFANLKMYATYYAHETGESIYPEYYYAYDAGQLLTKVIANSQNTQDRATFLQTAKETTLGGADGIDTKTGDKNFTAADNSGRFLIKSFDDQGHVEITDTIVGKY